MGVREKASSKKRLIDAKVYCMELYNEMNYLGRSEEFMAAIDVAIADLADAPTVDAVEVVRCRECKHWKPSGSKAGNSFSNMEYIGGCEFTNYYRSESDFCSYGERKEGAD